MFRLKYIRRKAKYFRFVSITKMISPPQAPKICVISWFVFSPGKLARLKAKCTNYQPEILRNKRAVKLNNTH